MAYPDAQSRRQGDETDIEAAIAAIEQALRDMPIDRLRSSRRTAVRRGLTGLGTDRVRASPVGDRFRTGA